MIAPRCGCIRAAKQEQFVDASRSYEADPPRGRSWLLRGERPHCVIIIASSLVPHPRTNLIRGRRLMLHLILATLVIVIATNVIAGLVIASTLLLLRKGRP